ncbi:MAG: helix-turn-helix transcriptional regulator [Ruminococcus sp.]|nr:helix-turn-helix transcriptional regulator [Ruminococcus sp.]
MPVIDVKATGSNIKQIIKSKGFRIADVQARCGFNTPQAIFKWLRGDSVPTIDNLIILADMFDLPIDKIIIITRV